MGRSTVIHSKTRYFNPPPQNRFKCAHRVLLCPLAPLSSLEHRVRAFSECEYRIDTTLNHFLVLSSQLFVGYRLSRAFCSSLSRSYKFFVALLLGCFRHDLSVGIFMQTPYAKVAL